MGAKMFSPAVKKWCPEFQPILGEIEMSPKSVCDCSTVRLPALASADRYSTGRVSPSWKDAPPAISVCGTQSAV